MRFPSVPILLRALQAFTNTTSRYSTYSAQALQHLGNTRITPLRASMPLSFIGSLFSSAPKHNMSYPVQKSDDEWQAVLNKGTSTLLRPPADLTTTHGTTN